MTTTENEIRELGRRWTEAEQCSDVRALDAMSAEDFTLVGPAGFVVDREQWFAGYSSGALEIRALSWEEVQVRDYGRTAVAIGVRTQEGTYQGNPAGGRFRGTQVAVHRDGRWLMAGMHLSPIVG